MIEKLKAPRPWRQETVHVGNIGQRRKVSPGTVWKCKPLTGGYETVLGGTTSSARTRWVGIREGEGRGDKNPQNVGF